MAERYEDWLRILKKYKASIKEDLRQIRACKAEIQSIKDEFLEELGAGKYIRDDKRIVISARKSSLVTSSRMVRCGIRVHQRSSCAATK